MFIRAGANKAKELLIRHDGDLDKALQEALHNKEMSGNRFVEDNHSGRLESNRFSWRSDLVTYAILLEVKEKEEE